MSEVTIEQMQEAVRQLKSAKDHYKEKKAESDAAHAIQKGLEFELIDMLDKTGQRTFEVTGFGKATVTDVLSVTTPKSNEEKKAFFAWLKEHKGEDTETAYMTVNSQSLNSLYKTLSEEAAANGEVLNIDGLEAPTSMQKLSFRKA